MLVEQLNVFNFRNIATANLKTDASVNVFYGENGSGKTSILETLFFISRAKSFRTKKRTDLLKSLQPQLAVNVIIKQKQLSHSLGVGLDGKGTARLKIDGDYVNRLSDVSDLIPIQLITKSGFKILILYSVILKLSGSSSII